MKITPTPVTAALAGFLSALVMPYLWTRFSDSGTDSISLVIAFLLVVALPAHAFVVGFDRSQMNNSNKLDKALLQRVGAWLAVAILTVGIGAVFSG